MKKSSRAVSYTHLDVYKRQMLMFNTQYQAKKNKVLEKNVINWSSECLKRKQKMRSKKKELAAGSEDLVA